MMLLDITGPRMVTVMTNVNHEMQLHLMSVVNLILTPHAVVVAFAAAVLGGRTPVRAGVGARGK